MCVCVCVCVFVCVSKISGTAKYKALKVARKPLFPRRPLLPPLIFSFAVIFTQSTAVSWQETTDSGAKLDKIYWRCKYFTEKFHKIATKSSPAYYLCPWKFRYWQSAGWKTNGVNVHNTGSGNYLWWIFVFLGDPFCPLLEIGSGQCDWKRTQNMAHESRQNFDSFYRPVCPCGIFGICLKAKSRLEWKRHSPQTIKASSLFYCNGMQRRNRESL